MERYLVGGAVRDQLLHLPVQDKDWVVVGATPEQMIEQGYQQVGKDFPVYLHPATQEEHALARTEKKSGHGYGGFICQFSPDVTLEQDLLRRDLTINAIAQNEAGLFIDPFNGRLDIENRILRHISPAFKEDPLRVLRVARFAARFYTLGFSIAAETRLLMQEIVMSNELQFLTPERIWKETEKALATQNPEIYFEVLRQCGALAVIFPELDKLFGIPAPEKWHPEIDSGWHSLLSIKQITQLTDDLTVRFAVTFHDIGKGATPPNQWPHHFNHGLNGLPLIDGLVKRLKIPNRYHKTALMVCQYHDEIHVINRLSSQMLIELLNQLDVWRTPYHLEQLLLSSTADYRGRLGWQDRPYPQADYLREVYQLAKQIDVQSIIQDGFKGEEIKQQLFERRQLLVDKSLDNLRLTYF